MGAAGRPGHWWGGTHRWWYTLEVKGRQDGTGEWGKRVCHRQEKEAWSEAVKEGQGLGRLAHEQNRGGNTGFRCHGFNKW